uniref:WD repeat-containing protein 37-like n=1 Tax=Styela clava TaxID=7725 RepID=UPI00193A136B|nr:WD repeat-containing protein 37-like [Styela clava]
MEASQKRDDKKSRLSRKQNGAKERESSTNLLKDSTLAPSGHPGIMKDLSFKRDKSNRGLSSDTDLTGEESLPPHVKDRLHQLFAEIEGEFTQLYNENLELRKNNMALNERLQSVTSDKHTESVDGSQNGADNKALLKSKSGLTSSQFSQKLKTTYRTGTSKLVSSFKTSATATCSVTQELRGHKDGVLHVDASPIVPATAGSASADQTAKLWNLNTGHCYGTYRGHTGSVNCIRFHPTKQLVLTASGDGSAHLWPFESPMTSSLMTSADEEMQSDRDEEPLDTVDTSASLMRSLCHMSAVVACDWLMDGQHFVTASWDRTACLVDSSTTQVVQTLSGHDQQLTHVSAHPQHKLVVTSSRDATFRVCDFRVSTLHSVIVGQGHSHSVTSAVFTQDDKIVSGSDDRCVKVWDLKNMRSAIATMRFDSPVNRLSVNQKGVIAIPHDNRQIRLFDMSGVRLARLPRDRSYHRRMVSSTAWVDSAHSSGHKTKLLTAGWDKVVLGWAVNIPNSLINHVK